MSGDWIASARQLAHGWLGWSPALFWAATPVDLRAALEAWAAMQGVTPRQQPLDGATLAALMARHPD